MPEYKPLPDQVQNICRTLNAPPRLVAHLTLVHDSADRLLTEIKRKFPNIKIEEDHVRFGAATHDIGKALHPSELSEPGHNHEAAGVELLKKNGISDRLARFAWTHANWNADPTLELEDLMVALADNCWRGKRVPELENLIVQKISQQTQTSEWQVFAELDDVIQQIASEADERLAWQQTFPLSR